MLWDGPLPPMRGGGDSSESPAALLHSLWRCMAALQWTTAAGGAGDCTASCDVYSILGGYSICGDSPHPQEIIPSRPQAYLRVSHVLLTLEALSANQLAASLKSGRARLLLRGPHNPRLTGCCCNRGVFQSVHVVN